MSRIVCYTCITGNYDILRKPAYISSGIDFICFSDNKKLQSDIWKIRDIPEDLTYLNNIKKQRIVKICPHRYLSDYDISIWIDGNILVKNDLNLLLAEYDLNKVPFYTRIHPSRNCTYEEANAVLKFKKENPETVKRIVDRYKAEYFPEHIGMAETCVILRKHNDKRCVLLDNTWATELLLNSHRDQLSFNYVCWKLKFLPGYMVNQFKINKNEYFDFNRHG